MRAKTSRCLRNLLVVVLILSALYVAYRYTLRRRVEAKLDEIRKQGYPATLAELDEWYPQPPPGENAADLYLKAFSLCVTNSADETLPFVGTAHIPSRSTPLPEEMKRGIAQYLERNQAALNLFHEASNVKLSRYPTEGSDLKTLFVSLLDHLRLIRVGMRMLSLECLLNSSNGDSDRAAGAIKALLALAESTKARPKLITYLSEQPIQGMAVEDLEQALSRTSFKDDQLKNLMGAFHEVETANAFSFAIIGERAQANTAWQEMLNESGSARKFMVDWDKLSNFDQIVATLYRPLGLIDLDYLARLEFFDEFLRASKVPFPEGLKQMASLKDKHALFNVLPVAKQEVKTETDMPNIEGRNQSRLRAVYTSLGIERYRLSNGTLPDSLNTLVPRFLSEVPADPFDGRPLRYKKLTRGYVVYSVGQDGKDDGGVEPRGGYPPGTDITFTVEH